MTSACYIDEEVASSLHLEFVDPYISNAEHPFNSNVTTIVLIAPRGGGAEL